MGIGGHERGRAVESGGQALARPQQQAGSGQRVRPRLSWSWSCTRSWGKVRRRAVEQAGGRDERDVRDE